MFELCKLHSHDVSFWLPSFCPLFPFAFARQASERTVSKCQKHIDTTRVCMQEPRDEKSSAKPMITDKKLPPIQVIVFI